MALVIKFLKASKEFQIARTGVMGFSKAGEAIILSQLHEKHFDAIAAMDAQPGGEALKFLTDQNPASITLPILAFFSNHQGNLSYEEASQSSAAFTFLSNSQVSKIRLMESNHGELTSAAILGELVPGYNRWPAFGNARLGYETLCQVTLAFFNLHLKHQADKPEILDDPIRALALPPKFLVKH